ncbi:MAG: hypothetical protein ACE5FW_03135 [Candidatus Aenigmatarchaeota archaeon]
MKIELNVQNHHVAIFVAAVLIVAGIGLAVAAVPNPGHSAAEIGTGTFGEEGDYIFPGASKVGIGLTPAYSLDVESESTAIRTQSTGAGAGILGSSSTGYAGDFQGGKGIKVSEVASGNFAGEFSGGKGIKVVNGVIQFPVLTTCPFSCTADTEGAVFMCSKPSGLRRTDPCLCTNRKGIYGWWRLLDIDRGCQPCCG